MREFKDLEFKEHDMVKGAKEAVSKGIDMSEYTKAKHATIEFENGKRLSVLLGSVFYSNGVDTYEAMELGTLEPRGHLTKDEVTEYMKELQND